MIVQDQAYHHFRGLRMVLKRSERRRCKKKHTRKLKSLKNIRVQVKKATDLAFECL